MRLKFLDNFCSHTNLHGFAYIVQPTRHRIEKIFWTLSILISFMLTGILIHKLIIESRKNPTIIYTDQNVINIEDLNFPAVSVCPGLIYKTECRIIIDYEEIKSQLSSHEKDISHLNMTELKLMQIASLVTRDNFMSDNFPSLSIPTDDFMEIIEIFNESFPNHHYNITYLNFDIIRPFDKNPPSNVFADYARKHAVFLKHVLAPHGQCYTFNLPSASEIYNMDMIHSNMTAGTNTELVAFLKFDDLISGVYTQLETSSYPLKAMSEEYSLRIFRRTTICNQERMSYDHYEISFISSKKSGFYVNIHDPYEVIFNTDNYFTWAYDQMLVFTITPELRKIDDSLADEDLEFRNCYLQNEHNLKFFKVYTRVNCEHECLTQMTIESCGCAQYFMVRNQTTKICGTVDEKCFQGVENNFDEVKSNCKCLEPCDNVKYDVKLQSTEYNEDPKFFGNILKVRFAVDSTFAIRRRKSYTAVDFLSFVGGILGLFAGFSVLSGAEFIYYILLSPLIGKRQMNDSRVYPFVENERQDKELHRKSRVLKFLLEILENSSIHSFNLIGNDTKTLIERLIWLTLFVISMTLSTFMMKGVVQKFQDNRIIMKMEEKMVAVDQIPFPSVTIVRHAFFQWFEDTPENTSLDFDDFDYISALNSQVYYIVQHLLDSDSIFEYKTTSDFVEMLKLHSKFSFSPFILEKAKLNGFDLPFSEILTSHLLGFTFNLMDSSKLLNEQVISQDFYFSYGLNKNFSFPMKTAFGENGGMSLEFIIWTEPDSVLVIQNYYMIHPSNELPLSGYREGFQESAIYDILFTPEITKADDDLKSLDVNIRNCYFNDERKLKFFKVYTQRNCEFECISHVVDNECTCVPYNYVRDNITQVCDAYSSSNCVDIHIFLKLDAYDHLYKTHKVCRCLPLCNDVKYSYEIYKNKFHQNETTRNTLIRMRWKDSEYLSLVKMREFRLVDFFSYVGGILGLFAGISVLSIFELFYFLSLRLVTDLIRQ